MRQEDSLVPSPGSPESSARTPALDRYRGCLLGGAVGDALGAPVEFLSLGEIRSRYGPGGVTSFSPAYSRVGAITDDTQMTLFTAEGLLRADNAARRGEAVAVPQLIYHAYLRWLDTQGGVVLFPSRAVKSGWLVDVPELRSSRAPGMTCVSALRSGTMGTIERPLNDSKGCGGVMRVAPVGLATWEPFALGCQAAAITHGHASGYLSAGFLAQLVAAVLAGSTLEQAVDGALDKLAAQPNSEECVAAVMRAIRLAASGRATAERVESLGEGWVGEEALAIALYCALRADSFEQGVSLAVTHGGDSDSTGAIAGNILGALMGVGEIPQRWLADLELIDTVDQVARDLHLHFSKEAGSERPEDSDRYPAW